MAKFLTNEFNINFIKMSRLGFIFLFLNGSIEKEDDGVSRIE